MAGCCDPRGCNEMFGPRFARHLVARYRKRGLDKTASRIVEYVTSHGVEGATVLEVGGVHDSTGSVQMTSDPAVTGQGFTIDSVTRC